MIAPQPIAAIQESPSIATAGEEDTNDIPAGLRGIQNEIDMASPFHNDLDKEISGSEWVWHQGYDLLQGAATFRDGASGEALKRERPYDRLPAAAKSAVRKPLWRLSQDSTG